jgi:hypothetical protein
MTRLKFATIITALTGFMLAAATQWAVADFDPATLDYEIGFNGKRIHWQEFAFFVMPGEARDLVVHLPDQRGTEVTASAGRLEPNGDARWVWHAPEHLGLVEIDVRPPGAAPARLNVVVLLPMSRVENGAINGYRIGSYPDKPLRGNPIYLPPPGLIEVHPDMVDLPVSPHFTLGQFLCKQQPDHWPKYLVLREALVAKLEIILAEVNERGIRTDTFHVMSGYRTPWYNQTIGNGRYSRHVWGGAADIFIDTNGNGRMDDLNGDGRSGLKDARLLLEIIDDLYSTRKHERLHGGLGLYGPRPHRGPFVHVDARGHEARWSLP